MISTALLFWNPPCVKLIIVSPCLHNSGVCGIMGVIVQERK